jgi:catechol 2,3-dioxygenase-like lactoylglutathione lyase family enzyme
MQLHRGRLIDHVHLRVRDLQRSRRFYEAVFEVLGIPLTATPDHLSADELWIDQGGPVSHVHLAFQVADRAVVDRFHVAAVLAGGLDNGAPGERRYHPGYYAAFVFDPDGNNIEAVHHGPHRRSAPSVEIAFG